MNPLKLNQSVLTLVGVCASNQHTTVINQIRNLFFYGLMVVMHLINIAACGLYVVKYVSSDYNGAIYGLLATTVLICSEYTLIVLRYHYKKLRTIFATLNAIYQEYEGTASFSKSSYTNRIAGIVSFLCIHLYTPGFFIMSVSISTLDVMRCYIQDGLTDVKCLLTPYRYVLPWNEDTFTGWFCTFLYSTFFAGAYFVINAYFLSAFFTICVQFHALRTHFEEVLSEIEMVSRRDAEYDTKVKVILCEAIRFRILSKNLLDIISEAFSGILFFQLIGGVVFMSTSFFQTEMALKNPNVYVMTVLNCLVTSSANLYLYCFAGNVATNNLILFADALFESSWFKMPNCYQKYFIIMIAETQRPIYLDGFGLIRLSLEAFTKMLRAVCSYYLMFRTLGVK